MTELGPKDGLYSAALRLSLRGEQEHSETLLRLTETLDWSKPGLEPAVRFLLQLRGQKTGRREPRTGFVQIGDSIEEGRSSIRPASVQPYQHRFLFEVDSSVDVARNGSSLGLKSQCFSMFYIYSVYFFGPCTIPY